MNFTTAQKQAIAHRAGPCLVLAVPGAGKTTVLLARIKALVAAGVPADKIATITFSRLQAEDLRRRFQSRHGQEAQPTFSTIHAFCYRIVRAYGHDRGEQVALIEGHPQWNKYQLVNQLFFQYRHRFPKEGEIDDFFRIDGYLKNALLSYPDYQKQRGERYPAFEQMAHAYARFKSEHGLIDFDDMLLRTLQILDREPALLEAIRRRFPYYQIDEAQDTSRIQWEIIQKLAAPAYNLMMVADDDQAIYGFRGADPAYLLRFRDRFPTATIIKMEENYRSSPAIVSVAGKLISSNQHRYQKKARANQDADEKISLFLLKDLESQLQRLIKKIPEDLAKGSVAVLYRNNLSMIALADRLERMGLPFFCQSKEDVFFHAPVFLDVVDLLHFALDPSDFNTFKRIYYKLDAYLKKSFLAAVQKGEPYLPVLDRIAGLDETQNRFYQEKLDHLRKSFERIRHLSASWALLEIRDHLGYGAYLSERERQEGEGHIAGQRVMESLYAISRSTPKIADFLMRLEALPGLLQPSPQKTALTLSTIHGAKGLEYDTVWLIDLIENEFPSALAIQQARQGDALLMEEERRLFYVGITRAKSRLRLVGRKRVNDQPVHPSSFLDELK